MNTLKSNLLSLRTKVDHHPDRFYPSKLDRIDSILDKVKKRDSNIWKYRYRIQTLEI